MFEIKKSVKFNRWFLRTSIFLGILSFILIGCGKDEESTISANAGSDQVISTNSTATLDGSGSSDSAGNTLSYSWSFTAKPSGSSSTLSNSTIVNPTFTADVAGNYIVQLVVNNGTADSSADSVTITASDIAIANAGTDQSVRIDTTVTLDGSSSSDADGNTLSYSWSFTSKPSGSSSTLSSSTIVNPTFTADVAGNYIVQLVVNNGMADSSADSVTITASDIPIANAGTNQSVRIDATVTLDGSSSSDGGGNPLSYSWSFTSKPSGSSGTLSSSTIVNPTFTADVAGNYIVQLVVNNGMVDSSADSVTIGATAGVSDPEPADLSSIDVVGGTHTLRVLAPGAVSSIFYYDDDSGSISFSKNGTINGNYAEVIIAFSSGKFSDSGENYWYVEVTSSGPIITRYPESGYLTFTAY